MTERGARGGRPTAAAAARMEADILAFATRSFLRDGYAQTSIESVARQAGVAKRTIYARWDGKPALFRAVLEQLMATWLATAEPDWADAGSLTEALTGAAERILAVGLEPRALALHRLLVTESARFPELGQMAHSAGVRAGIGRIAALLDRAVEAGRLARLDTAFAAEQLVHLVLAGPRARALGLGPPLDEAGLRRWARDSVALFLNGLRRG